MLHATCNYDCVLTAHPLLPLIPYSLQAIHDGVIDAVLDHGAGTMSTAAAANVYLTAEPRDAFHRRITFCMDVHNEAVKAMRYPAQALREELESAEVRREREAEENELINELEKEGFDDDDDDE